MGKSKKWKKIGEIKRQRKPGGFMTSQFVIRIPDFHEPGKK